MSLGLAPDDKDTNQLLADCYIRQDKFALSVPHWRATRKDVRAKWFGALRGEAYQIHGDIARLPWQQLDLAPLVEASVNGGPANGSEGACRRRLGGRQVLVAVAGGL